MFPYFFIRLDIIFNINMVYFKQKFSESKIGVSHVMNDIRKIKKEQMAIKSSNVSTFLSHHHGGKRWVLSSVRSTSE